jgi:hypothetical protein
VIIFTEKGDQIRGDLINRIVVRSDCVPVPVTVEAEIRADESLVKLLKEGKTIIVGNDLFRIIKTLEVESRVSQGAHNVGGVKLFALLDNCHSVAFVRDKSIIKSTTTLSAVYKAAGATMKGLEGDIPIPRFSCFIGSVPSFHIARVMQEEGGVIRWKNGKMHFIRLPDLFKQKPVMTIPDNASDDVKSGFLERHEVPSCYSVDDKGEVVGGNVKKPRTTAYIPFKNAQQLQNMTRCLIHKKRSKVTLNMKLSAGDLIAVSGANPLAVITAAHVFESGTNGMGNQYTRLWLGELSS